MDALNENEELQTPLVDQGIYEDRLYVANESPRTGKSNALKYVTLAVALVAVCIGTAALVVTESHRSSAAESQAQLNGMHSQVQASKAAESVGMIVGSHPICSKSNSNWQTCVQMMALAEHVISDAAQLSTSKQDLAQNIASDVYGVFDRAAAVLHNGSTVLTASSSLSHLIGANHTIAEVSHCAGSTSTSCFACLPMSAPNQCLPIVHFKLSFPTLSEISRMTRKDKDMRTRRARYSASTGDLFHASGRTGAVVGSPTTMGASYHASGSVTAGSAHFDASAANNGGGNLQASENAGVTALNAQGSVTGTAHANLGDGVNVDANGAINANANAAASESAHADTHVGNGEASFSAGAGVSAHADAGVTGMASANLDTPDGNLNLGQVGGSLTAGAHAGASAGAHGSIGADGVSVGYHADAGATVHAGASGRFSLLDGAIHNSAHVGVSAGPHVGTSGGFHATDHNGDISVGASGGVAAALGLSAGDNLNINTHQLGQDAVSAADAVGSAIDNGVHDVGSAIDNGLHDVGSAIDNGVHDVESDFTGGSDGDSTSDSSDGSTGGSDGGSTGGSYGGSTGGSDGGSDGGSFGGSTGGSDGGSRFY